MKLIELVKKNDIQEQYAMALENLCDTLGFTYEIANTSFGVVITIKSPNGWDAIYCSKSTCLDEFSKFLQGYIFATDIARKKYNHY